MSVMLQSRLLTIVQRELDSQNLLLSPYCTQQIEVLITQGVERMRNNRVADNPGRLLNAEQNLKALVKYLRNYATDVGTYPHLGNADFDDALRTCPTFWPYCASG